MRIGDMHKPRPSSAGVILCSLSNIPDCSILKKGKLWPGESATIRCLHCGARNSLSFHESHCTLSINNSSFISHPDTCHRSPWTIKYTELLSTSHFLYHCRYTTVAPFPTCRERSLATCGTCKHGARRWDMSEHGYRHSDCSEWYSGSMLHQARWLSRWMRRSQQERYHVEGGLKHHGHRLVYRKSSFDGLRINETSLPGIRTIRSLTRA